MIEIDNSILENEKVHDVLQSTKKSLELLQPVDGTPSNMTYMSKTYTSKSRH